MRLYVKNIKLFLLLIVSYLFVVLFHGSIVSAGEYTYSGGTFTRAYESVNVISFNYDYTTLFTEQSGLYNGKDVYDRGNNLRDVSFYSGQRIVVNVDHVDKFWGWQDDNDDVTIYRYSEGRQDFDASLVLYSNKSGSYTLDQQGLYKVVYRFEGVEKYNCYIYITSELHDAFVKGNDSYNNVSAYVRFSFEFTLKDGYDLRNYSYYYAFGENEENLTFHRFELFSDEEKRGAVIRSFENRKVEVEILDEHECLSGEKKFLFVKIVRTAGGKEVSTVVSTKKQYKLSKNLEGQLLFVDNKGNYSAERMYYKKGDTITAHLKFNAAVTYSSLQASFNGNEFFNITDSSEIVDFIAFSYVVNEEVDVSDSFVIRTINNVDNKAIVNYAGMNLTLNLINEYGYDIDVNNPIVYIAGDEMLEISKQEYFIELNVKDSNIKEFEYYVDTCRIVQGEQCSDEFNKDAERMIKIGEEQIEEIIDINMVKIPIVINEELVGKVDGDKFFVFVRAVDKAGNETFYKKYGYKIDNLIVSGDEKELFVEEEVLSEDQSNVIGKKMLVKVPSSYNILSIKYFVSGMEEKAECNLALEGEVQLFNCMEVRDYYFASKLEVELVDEFGNVENYEKEIKYNNLSPGVFNVGSYSLNVYNDKNYDGEINGVINFMGTSEERLILDSGFLADIDFVLEMGNIPNLSDLVKSLVLMRDNELIYLVENVSESLVVPSNIEMLDILNDEEKSNKCLLKGEICEISAYLYYEYKANEYNQYRFIKINFRDNSLKLDLTDFVNRVEVEVFGSYQKADYKVYDGLNIEITNDDLVRIIDIVYVDLAGGSSSVEEIDANKVGTYKVSEIAMYDGLSSFPLKYEVVIVDNVAPSIRLVGNDKLTIKEGQDIGDILGFVEAYDEYDKKLVPLYEWDQEFDSSRVGTYVLSFWAVDSSGNKSNVVTKTIVVEESDKIAAYLISGGIVLFTVLVIVFGTIREVKKEKKKR